MALGISNALQTAINAPAQQVLPVVTVYWADSKQLTNMVVTSSSTLASTAVPCSQQFMTYYEAINGKLENSFRWGVADAIDADGYVITANGQYVATDNRPNARYEYAWWSSSKTDGSGNFASPEYLDVKCDLIQANYIELYVPNFMGHIKSYSVSYYDLNGALQSLGTFQMNQYDAYVSIPLPGAPTTLGCKGVRLTINSTWFPNDCARVCEFMPVYKEDVSQYVSKMDVSKMREYYNSDVPFGATTSNELSLTLDNTSKRFNRGNTSTVGPYIDRDSKIVVSTSHNTNPNSGSLANFNPPVAWSFYSGQTWSAQSTKTWAYLSAGGVNTSANFENVSQGEFYTDDFNYDSNSMTINIKARDYSKVLHENTLDKGFLSLGVTGAQGADKCARIGGVPDRKIVVHHAWVDQILRFTPTNFFRLGEASSTVSTDTASGTKANWSGGVGPQNVGALTSDPDQSINLTTGYATLVGTQAWQAKSTCMAWVKTFNSGTLPLFTVAGNSFKLVAGVPTFSNGTTTNSTKTVNDNNWHFVVMVNDGNFTSYYIDGVLDRSVAQTGTQASGTGYVGGDGTNSYTGLLDEVVLYRTAIAANDIYMMWQQAVIKPLRRYPYLYGKEKTIWDGLIDIATGDLGTFYFSEDGNFQYEPAQLFYETAFPRFTTSQYTLTGSTNIVSATEIAEIQANKVTVSVNPFYKPSKPTDSLWRGPSPSSLAFAQLNGNIDQNALSIPVDSTNAPASSIAAGLPNFAAGGFIKIDNEIMQYSSIDANHFIIGGVNADPLYPSVQPGRGMFGTVATSHSSGALVREARRYEIKYTKSPALEVKYPFITAQIFDKTVDIDLWEFNNFTADLIVSGSLNSANVTGSVVFLEGKSTKPNSKNTLDNAMELYGTPIALKEGEQAVYKSLNRYNTISRRFGLRDITINNSFVHDNATANQIADFITTHYGKLVPILTVEVLGIPHLQLGDRVTINNFNQLDISGQDYWVIQNKIAFDGGIKQSLTLRQVS